MVDREQMTKAASIAHQFVAYVAAIAAAVGAGWFSAQQFDAHLLVYVLIADIVGTVVIFGFSRFHDNSSLYDPYWSVAPIVIAAAYFVLGAELSPLNIAALAAVTYWGCRLTYNFFYGWPGMHHEDWRYVDFRDQFPKAYWWVSFGGVHFFPTLIVFVGCFGLYSGLLKPEESVPALAWTGVAVMVAATTIEAVADIQLHRWIASKPPEGSIINTGLWRYSRHPNYFGELSFWWGVWLFGVGASPGNALWTFAGPLAMTCLFLFVSIPLLDKRSLARREGYAEHMERVSAIVPLPPRGAS